jgi:hypothetical protein
VNRAELGALRACQLSVMGRVGQMTLAGKNATPLGSGGYRLRDALGYDHLNPDWEAFRWFRTALSSLGEATAPAQPERGPRGLLAVLTGRLWRAKD